MKLNKIILMAASMASILVATENPTTTNVSQTLVEDASFGASVGTLGINAEYTHLLSQKYGLTLRIMGGGFSYSGTYKNTDIIYDTNIDLRNLGAVLEYHPFHSGLYMGGGLFYNSNDFTMHAKPTARKYSFDGTDYDETLVGTVDGKVQNLNTAVPYVGIGYDDSLFDNSALFLTLKAGVWYQGSPKVSLTAEDCALDTVPGGLLSCNDLRGDLQQEERDINNDIKNYKWWPVLQIGFVYKF